MASLHVRARCTSFFQESLNWKSKSMLRNQPVIFQPQAVFNGVVKNVAFCTNFQNGFVYLESLADLKCQLQEKKTKQNKTTHTHRYFSAHFYNLIRSIIRSLEFKFSSTHKSRTRGWKVLNTSKIVKIAPCLVKVFLGYF